MDPDEDDGAVLFSARSADSDAAEGGESSGEPAPTGTLALLDGPQATGSPRQEPPEHVAAVRIQALFRRAAARKAVLMRAREATDRIFDPDSGSYYYAFRATGRVSWTPPALLRGQPFEPREEQAATRLQALFRRRAAWLRALEKMDASWEKGYDAASGSWYYIHRGTGETRWDKPRLYGSREPPINATDNAVLEKDKEIAQLKALLEEKEAVAKEAAEALEAERRQLAIRRGDADPDEACGRSRHMDEWSGGDVIAWFAELGLGQYEAQLKTSLVDGLLLLHMAGEDWGHLGVKSALHARRIEVAMHKYRLRYENVQAGAPRDGSSDGLSDVSASDTPSELYEAEEDAEFDAADGYGGRLEDDGGGSAVDGGGAVDEGLTADEIEQLERDRRNITKEVIFPGDSEERPEPGDVVRIHYTCTTLAGQLVESSRKTRRRAFEFVLGAQQVILGLDRGVGSMTFGERARLTISADYGYGAAGQPPAVPPGATLVFDVNVIQFWPRPRWHKPLIQVSGPYGEKPYAPKPKRQAAATPEDGSLDAGERTGTPLA